MLNRVNKYLSLIPSWRNWFASREQVSSSNKSCCIYLYSHEATLAVISNLSGKLELEICKTVSFNKGADLAIVLEKLVKQLRLENMPCIWLLDQAHYQAMIVEDIPVDPSEFQAAIRWKIKNMLSFPTEDAVIDKFSLPVQKTFNAQKMIMVIAAKASYLQSICKKIESAGLHLSTIDTPELSLRNITAMYEQDEVSSALIYLQSKNSQLIITHKQQLYLSRRIEFQFDALKSIEINANHYLEKLALELQRSFDYFQSQWRMQPPTRIFLAVTQPTNIEIADVLSSFLGVTVKMLDLNEVIVNRAGLDREEQYRLLPLMGCLLRTEILEHATTN